MPKDRERRGVNESFPQMRVFLALLTTWPFGLCAATEWSPALGFSGPDIAQPAYRIAQPDPATSVLAPQPFAATGPIEEMRMPFAAPPPETIFERIDAPPVSIQVLFFRANSETQAGPAPSMMLKILLGIILLFTLHYRLHAPQTLTPRQRTPRTSMRMG